MLRQDAIHMQGAEVFKVAVNTLATAVEEMMTAHGLEQSAVDWLIPHQANLRLIEAVARKLRFPMERVVVTVNEHGNTSAASVPLALDRALRDGRVKPGQLVLLEAFGGRLHVGLGAASDLTQVPNSRAGRGKGAPPQASTPLRTHPRRLPGPARRVTSDAKRSGQCIRRRYVRRSIAT